MIITNKTKKIPKGWGHELVIVNDYFEGYSSKLLHFYKNGNKSSMHFHLNKHETFYVLEGSFSLTTIDPNTAVRKTLLLEEGDSVEIYRGALHQLIAQRDHSVMLEVATHDTPEDSYRVEPGDSQSE